MAAVVLDEAVLGATDTFAAKQGAGGEAAEDLDNGIVREASQCIPLVGSLLHFVSNEITEEEKISKKNPTVKSTTHTKVQL